MAAREVVGKVLRPDGTVASYATVEIDLIASTTGKAIGWVPTADLGVGGRTIIKCDAAGAWSISVQPNSLIDPTGTVYQIRYRDGSWSTTFEILVPDTLGPHRVEDILTTSPTALPTVALLAHEADTTGIHGITDTSLLYRVGGTDVAITDGGSGASTDLGARANLKLQRYFAIDIRDKGAVAGGAAATNRAAIAQAITDATVGQWIYVDEGTFDTDAVVSVSKRVTLFGPGTVRGGSHPVFQVTAADVTFRYLTLVRATTAAISATLSEKANVIVNGARFKSINCSYTNAAHALVYLNHGACNDSEIVGGVWSNAAATQNGCAVYAAAGNVGNQRIKVRDINYTGTGAPDGILFFDSSHCDIENNRVTACRQLPTLTVGANWTLVSGTTYRWRSAAGTPGVTGVSTDREDGSTRVLKQGGTAISENTATPSAPGTNEWGLSGGYVYINLGATDPNTQTMTSDIVGGYGIMFYRNKHSATDPDPAQPMIGNRARFNRVSDTDGFGIYLQLGFDLLSAGNGTEGNTLTSTCLKGVQFTSLPFAAIGITYGIDTTLVGDIISGVGTAVTYPAPGIRITGSTVGCTGRATAVSVKGATSDGIRLDAGGWEFDVCVSSGNTRDGFYLAASTSAYKDVVFSGCHAESNALRGFLIESASGGWAGAVLNGCTAASNTQNGIRLIGARQSTVTGCQVRNNGSTSFPQIRVDATSREVSIVGNAIVSALSPSIGVELIAGAAEITVDGNSILAATPISAGSAYRTGTHSWAGSGTPEGVVTAAIGSVFHRSDGGAGTSYYVKESGTGNIGWVGK